MESTAWLMNVSKCGPMSALGHGQAALKQPLASSGFGFGSEKMNFITVILLLLLLHNNNNDGERVKEPSPNYNKLQLV